MSANRPEQPQDIDDSDPLNKDPGNISRQDLESINKISEGSLDKLGAPAIEELNRQNQRGVRQKPEVVELSSEGEPVKVPNYYDVLGLPIKHDNQGGISAYQNKEIKNAHDDKFDEIMASDLSEQDKIEKIKIINEARQKLLDFNKKNKSSRNEYHESLLHQLGQESAEDEESHDPGTDSAKPTDSVNGNSELQNPTQEEKISLGQEALARYADRQEVAGEEEYASSDLLTEEDIKSIEKILKQEVKGRMGVNLHSALKAVGILQETYRRLKSKDKERDLTVEAKEELENISNMLNKLSGGDIKAKDTELADRIRDYFLEKSKKPAKVGAGVKRKAKRIDVDQIILEEERLKELAEKGEKEQKRESVAEVVEAPFEATKAFELSLEDKKLEEINTNIDLLKESIRYIEENAGVDDKQLPLREQRLAQLEKEKSELLSKVKSEPGDTSLLETTHNADLGVGETTEHPIAKSWEPVVQPEGVENISPAPIVPEAENQQPKVETQEDKGVKLVPQETEKDDGEEKVKIPEEKNLFDVIRNIKAEEGKEKADAELKRIIKTFQKGEKVYGRLKDGTFYYLKLKENGIEYDVYGDLSLLVFEMYDKNGQIIKGKMVKKKMADLKYREWKKLKRGEGPGNGSVFVKDNGEAIKLKMEEEDDKIVWKDEKTGDVIDLKKDSELRTYEDAFKEKIKSRSQVVEEFKVKQGGGKVKKSKSKGDVGQNLPDTQIIIQEPVETEQAALVSDKIKTKTRSQEGAILKTPETPEEEVAEGATELESLKRDFIAVLSRAIVGCRNYAREFWDNGNEKAEGYFREQLKDLQNNRNTIAKLVEEESERLNEDFYRKRIEELNRQIAEYDKRANEFRSAELITGETESEELEDVENAIEEAGKETPKKRRSKYKVEHKKGFVDNYAKTLKSLILACKDYAKRYEEVLDEDAVFEDVESETRMLFNKLAADLKDRDMIVEDEFYDKIKADKEQANEKLEEMKGIAEKYKEKLEDKKAVDRSTQEKIKEAAKQDRMRARDLVTAESSELKEKIESDSGLKNYLFKEVGLQNIPDLDEETAYYMMTKGIELERFHQDTNFQRNLKLAAKIGGSAFSGGGTGIGVVAAGANPLVGLALFLTVSGAGVWASRKELDGDNINKISIPIEGREPIHFYKEEDLVEWVENSKREIEERNEKIRKDEEAKLKRSKEKSKRSVSSQPPPMAEDESEESSYDEEELPDTSEEERTKNKPKIKSPPSSPLPKPKKQQESKEVPPPFPGGRKTQERTYDEGKIEELFEFSGDDNNEGGKLKPLYEHNEGEEPVEGEKKVKSGKPKPESGEAEGLEEEIKKAEDFKSLYKILKDAGRNEDAEKLSNNFNLLVKAVERSTDNLDVKSVNNFLTDLSFVGIKDWERKFDILRGQFLETPLFEVFKYFGVNTSLVVWSDDSGKKKIEELQENEEFWKKVRGVLNKLKQKGPLGNGNANGLDMSKTELLPKIESWGDLLGPYEEYRKEAQEINSIEKIATALGLKKDASIDDIMGKIEWFQLEKKYHSLSEAKKLSAEDRKIYRSFNLVLENFKNPLGFWLDSDQIEVKLKEMQKNKKI